MIVSISNEFLKSFTSQVHYIYKDKPQAALKFRKDFLKNMKKDLNTLFISKDPDILMMNILEIMFLKDMSLFMKLILKKK